MDKNVLIVLGVFAVLLLAIGLNGKITGNAFAYNPERSCTDSDGGNDRYTLGTGVYKGLSSAKPIEFADTCVNAANLLEHYCDGPVHLTETVPCDCENGACRKF